MLDNSYEIQYTKQIEHDIESMYEIRHKQNSRELLRVWCQQHQIDLGTVLRMRNQ